MKAYDPTKTPIFKVGDRVRPKSWIDHGGDSIMWSEESGTVAKIYEVTTNPNLPNTHGCVVKADKGGFFRAHEMHWEKEGESK